MCYQGDWLGASYLLLRLSVQTGTPSSWLRWPTAIRVGWISVRLRGTRPAGTLAALSAPTSR